MYQIFHESPSRARDYEQMAEATRSYFPSFVLLGGLKTKVLPGKQEKFGQK